MAGPAAKSEPDTWVLFPARFLLLRREQLVRLVEAAQPVQPERPQRSAVDTGEIVADDQRQIERLRHRFDAADQIDAGSDDGEVEPVRRADVAVDHRAVVERDHHPERVVARGFAVDRLHGGQRLGRCRHRRGCGLRRVGRDRKHGQQAVADEFRFAAVACNRAGLGVEHLIENGDDLFAGNRSDSSVKLRKSDDHNTAATAPPVPRRIWPAKTRGPVSGPRWAFSTFSAIMRWLCISTAIESRSVTRVSSAIWRSEKPPGRSVT